MPVQLSLRTSTVTMPSIAPCIDSPPLTDSGSDADDPLDVPRVKHAVRSRFERRMGDSELSYFLPSRADGVNDMYLHLGFRAPSSLLAHHRLRAVWALLRLRHPPLASSVDWHDYDDVRFVYVPPASPIAALYDADCNLRLSSQSKDVLIDTYLNGPRTLSNHRLSFLIHSTRAHSDQLPTPLTTPTFDQLQAADPLPEDAGDTQDEQVEHDMLICAAHFLGDGMALHRFANDLFTILCSDLSTAQIESNLTKEWEARWANRNTTTMEGWAVLPPALEDSLPPTSSSNKLRQAAVRVDFENSQAKLIGGHTFPRSGGDAKAKQRHTIVPTIPFSEQTTKRILKKCKERGVSVANALFAVCNVAWARTCLECESNSRPELPVMMYSALNLRPYLTSQISPVTPSGVPIDPSFWFLAVGYFNVILPNFIPRTQTQTDDTDGHADKADNANETDKTKDEEDTLTKIFWHRARQAKKQGVAAAKHPMLVSRTREMACVRANRAKVWAKEDDELEMKLLEKDSSKSMAKLANTTALPTPPPDVQNKKLESLVKPTILPTPPSSPTFPSLPEPNARAKSPSTALLGLSLLGNLDSIYKHPIYAHRNLTMHALTTGSRQRKGGMLLFAYTFAGRLWVSLGYDVNGFERERVGDFWEGVLECVGEFLM